MKMLLPRVACLAFLLFAGQNLFASGHTVTISSVTNVYCNGSGTGSATASVSGGVGPFSYSWAPAGGTNATANGLFAGSYTCTVTDQSDMSTATQTVTITQPPALTLTGSSTNVLCNGQCTGSATVTPSGGTAPYTYSWWPNGGTGSTTTGRCAGTYTATVTDANGCVATRTYVITQPATITLSVSIVHSTCNMPNGSATVTASGGVPGYTYIWSPTGGTNVTANGLVPGAYTVTVTDANGCNNSAMAMITGTPGPTVTISSVGTTCFGACNGSSTSNVTGGTGPYTYSWAPGGGTSPFITGSCAGSYTLTVTDANGCVGTATTMITQPPALTISTNASPASICAGNSSTISGTPSGGTGAYTYVWSPGGMTSASALVTPTSTTTYTLTVTDSNGCSGFQSVTVTVNASVSGSVSVTDANCSQSNGAASVTVTTGTPPYTYLWSNSATTSSITNVTAGAYNVTVTDAQGCSQNFPANISNLAGPSVTISAVSTGCTNASNGSATASVSGTAPFTYSWTTNPVQTAATATNLGTGTYQLTVTDAGGCITTDQVTISALSGNLFLWAQPTAYSNCNQSTGAAEALPYGGTAPYTYAWSNGATTDSITGLLAGNYAVTVTDANGCSASGGVNIPNNCANVISGRFYVDTNSDCQYNTGDYPMAQRLLQVMPGSYYVMTDLNGNYQFNVLQPGTYTLSPVALGLYYAPVCPVSGTIQHTFPALGDSLMNADLAMLAIPAQDLTLSLSSGPARPGFQQYYNIMCSNVGSVAVSDTIFFRHDSILTLVNSSPVMDGYTAPEGYWLFTLQPGQTITKTVYVQVPTIPNGGYVGRQLIANARIEPIANDSTPLNNGDDEVDFITAAIDPNLKECWAPMMNMQTGDIDLYLDTTLSYTIHFQNTGNDTCFTVVVKDTLPPQLNIATLQPGASSHPYTLSVEGAQGINALTFTFNNILLPDSFVNEPASHGWVKFKIDRMPGLPVGTLIENEAHNYFDFNPAIVTNMTSNMIVNPLSSSTLSAAGSVKAFPNPFDESTTLLIGDESQKSFTVEVFDVSGRRVLGSGALRGNRYELKRGALESGVYLCRVQGEVQAVIKLIVR